MNCPQHLIDRVSRLVRLQDYAHFLSFHYGKLPVYLCGSAMLDSNMNPRDWDLAIEMFDEVFEERFKIKIAEWAVDTGQLWGAEMAMMSRKGWDMTKLNIDFQLCPLSWAKEKFKGKKKMKLSISW
jgi:hypothetical protein